MNRVSGSFNIIHVLSFIFSQNHFNLFCSINPERFHFFDLIINRLNSDN